jgi:putative salt-induced outer membrane protein YdiY
MRHVQIQRSAAMATDVSHITLARRMASKSLPDWPLPNRLGYNSQSFLQDPEKMILQRMMSLAVLLAMLSMFPGDNTQAATVVMANGERFVGDIVSMVDGELLLENQYAGEIKLPWSAVSELISETALRLHLPDERVINSTAQAATPGSLTLADAPPSDEQSLLLAQIVAINPPVEDPYEYHWRGKSNIGLNATSGNSDTTRFHVDSEVTVENDFNRYIAGIDFNRGSDNNLTSVDNWTAYGSYDHFVSEKLFWNNTISFKQNGLQELDLRSAIGSGLGYQFFDADDLRLSTTAGLSYVREDFTIAPSQEFLAFQFGLDYEHQWFDWLRFFFNMQALTSFEDISDFVLRTRSGLRYPISDNFVASLQVNFDYDNTPSEGAEKEDILYAFTLGYNW